MSRPAALPDPAVPELAMLAPAAAGPRALASRLARGPSRVPGGADHWSRVYLGSDLCERLLPRRRRLSAMLDLCRESGLAVSLLTPALSDDGLRRLRACLECLPAGAEVVANDWGTLRLLRRSFAHLRPVAGRSMARMVKDPRLPDARWSGLYPSAVGSAEYSRFVRGLGFERLELDVPPFASPDGLRVPELSVSVYAPFGCCSRGRICRIGSLGQVGAERFAVDRPCRRECLVYANRLGREGRTDLETWQVGNAMLYRHDGGMHSALVQALASGYVDRIVDNQVAA